MPVFIPIVREPEFKLKGLPQNIAMTEKQIRGILMKADRDGDGCLSKDELKKAFKEFGSRMPCWRASCCLRKVDTNRDGKISRDEIDFVVDYVLVWLESKN
ncbi:putative EF-hand domain pair protein [Medicago truncatula]|uniref:EF-hand pair protein n=1 Tax=Medicago truncatula TaxID=3880 RepID=G7I3M0_MEDTR|nr:EF-hand pair protein [Medicago truncatula]RHN77321.1 putative EF-hand domain pair protein [Medicago truncatula]